MVYGIYRETIRDYWQMERGMSAAHWDLFIIRGSFFSHFKHKRE